MNPRAPYPTQPSVSVRELRQILVDHRYGVFLASLLLAIAGIMMVSILPNVYRATTTILVDPQKIPEKYVSSTVTTDPNGRMNTLTQQVLSASRLQEIIDRDNLYPDLRKRKTREEVIDYMREKTKITLKQSPEPEQGLSSFSISYEDQNRWQVAKVTNQLASSFINWSLKMRVQQAAGTTQFLSGELERAKASLEQQESQLEAFRMSHPGATPDQLNGNLQALNRLQAGVQATMDAISRLDQERIMLAQVKPADLREKAPTTERARLLQEKRRLESQRWALKQQFTDTYPDVVVATQQLKDIDARLAAMPVSPVEIDDSGDSSAEVRISLINKELERQKQLQGALQRQIYSYQSKVDSVPILETQLAELTRNYEVSKQNYQSLLDKRFSAGMSEELERKQQAERFTVLDVAKTPEKPIKPNRLLLMAVTILFALLIPSSTVVASHLLSGAIQSEVALRGVLPPTIPIIGIIPPIQNGIEVRRNRLILAKTITISLVAYTALFLFLLKVRPIL